MKYAIGIAIIAVGIVVAIGFANAQFLWFTGRPFGVVLAAIGAWELWDAYREDQKKTID
ncbi:hypothetical protein ACMYYO_13870 [Dermacoccaceae bacterium W4C1]